MAEEFVSKKEFDNLEKKVNKIEEELDNSSKLLNVIDKKVDGILIKLEDNNKIDDLTLKPLNERVTKLEGNQTWLWRTIGATVIGIVIKIIFDVSKIIK